MPDKTSPVRSCYRSIAMWTSFFVIILCLIVWYAVFVQGSLRPAVISSLVSREAQGLLPSTLIEINGHQLLVELAADDASRIRGLSYRESLDADRGMLFIFPSANRQNFWMKGMKFPLDIIFIRDHRVVRVASDVPTSTGPIPTIVSSQQDADQVLEMNAGEAKKLGIEVGTEVKMLGTPEL
jgi:uncharacterized protein